MAKQRYVEVSCTDVGPGCGAVLRVATEQEFWELGRVHARVAHGLEELPAELVQRVKAAMKSVEVDVPES